MRLASVALMVLGLVVAVVGTFSGCGSLFTWNGRHPIDSTAIDAPPGNRVVHTLYPKPGRHYTLSIQVVFAREGLPRQEGVVVVDAKMALVARVTDRAGTKLAEAVGWIDPNEPPNVLYGQTARESTRGPMPELLVERLVGPFAAASDAPLSIEVDLGSDRVRVARIDARRLVIHDDALPPTIRNAFMAAGVGSAAFVFGLGLVLFGWFKRRRPKRV